MLLGPKGKSVGMVPTMGFLHAGHASLIKASAADNDVTLTTIFVNPLQFGADEDLSDYPRDLERDLELCEGAGATIVLTPSVDEMYPQPIVTTVTVDELSAAMEGAERPTHFAGCRNRCSEAVPHRRPLPGVLRRKGLPAVGDCAPHGF